MTIEYSPDAITELNRIRNLYSELSGPRSAENHLKRITHSISLLKVTPEMGVSLKTKHTLLTDYRYIVTDRYYLVIYRVEKSVVRIATIVDGRTNYLPYLVDLTGQE